jgi:FKBP-type peptidyl-prolyl cis-trans isomerase
MTTTSRTALLLALMLVATSCRLKEEADTTGAKGPIPAPADVAAPPADAHRTPSGLASKVLRVGLGNVKPTLTSTVTVHYTGWTTDGKMFDTSTDGSPITAPLTRPNGAPSFIQGWIEALQLMRVGEKRRVWIPGNLAYDNIPDAKGQPPNPKGMLVFDIEMLMVR